MAIGNHNDLTHIVRTSDQWKNTYDKYELIPNGVLCVELVSSDVTKIKIGDGHNIFSKLPYIGDLDLSKYYTKLETDTRIKEILSQEKVVRIKGILNSKSDLPADARCGDIYFVRQLSSSDNKYIEYIYSPDNTWEPLGGIPVDIDLSEYAKTAYVDDKIEQVNERIDDIEQHGTHTHPNKEILDQITEPYTTADKETLASLHNYDDTEIREMISQSSHTHANKEILDATSAAFTREDKSKLDQLNPYDDSVLKEKITALERLAHEHSNKRILDQTTASFTKEYERKMRWIRIYTGCTGMEEGIAGLVPAAQAGEEDYVLSGSGEWVPQTGGGGTYTLPIATASTLGGIKVGSGLEIDANGVLSATGGGGGGDSIAEGGGINITTDPQTGVKTISVNTGDNLEVDPNTGELNVTGIDYTAGEAINIRNTSGGNLPSGYVEVDYIEGDGNCYTVIDYIPNRKTKIVGSAALTGTTNDPVLFGARTGSSGNQFVFWFNRYDSTQAKVGFVYGTNTWSTSTDCNDGRLIPYVIGEQFTFLLSLDDEFNINDTFVHNITENGAPADYLKLGIFALVDDSSGNIESDNQIFMGRMYEFKIYEDDVLVVELIPAVNSTTGSVGFYDTVNDKFYTSNRSTQFTYDPSTIHVSGKSINVKYGNGLVVNQNNELEVNVGDGLSINANDEVELSKATANDLGGIKVGSGFVYTSDGLLNAAPAAPPFDVGDGLELIYDDIDALPSGYGHVDYICSNPENNLINAHGRARTLIDYIPTNTTKLAIKMQRDSRISDMCFVGSRIGSGNREFCFWNEYPGESELAFVYGGTNYNGSYVSYPSYTTGDIIEVEGIVGDSSNTLSVDGTVVKTYTKTGTASPYKLGIFQLYLNGSWANQPANGKIYYIKLYEGNTLAVNLIPAVRLVDEVVGFYDNVNDKFYTSNTEYPFTTDMSTLVIDGAPRTLNVIPATANTIGGIKVGTGLSIAADGTLSTTGGETYDAGNGIEITEVTHEDEFRVQNQEYFFTDHGLTCIITGNYGPRTYTKINDGDIVAAVIGTTGGWYMPLFVGLTEDSVKYSNSYDSNILGPTGSFTYHDKTWYYTADYALTAGDGVDHANHLQSMTDTIYAESNEGKIQAAKDLIDLAVLLPDVSIPAISAKIGAGLSFDANGAIQADAQPLSPATDSTLGGVIIGEGINVDEYGEISLSAGEGLDIDFESPLPSEYTLVKGISSVGHNDLPYINTGYLIKPTSRIIVRGALYKTTSGWAFPIGVRHNNYSNPVMFCTRHDHNGDSIELWLPNDTLIASAADREKCYNDPVIITISNDGLNIENETTGEVVTLTTSDTLPTATLPLYVFATNDNSTISFPGSMDLYRLQIFEGTTKVLDYLPCKRNSDNKYGVYDIVAHEYKTSSNVALFEPVAGTPSGDDLIQQIKLLPATANTIGGVKQGDGILVDNDGTISVDPTIIPEVPTYEDGTAISIEDVEHGGVTFDAWNSGTGWENVCYTYSTGNSVVNYQYEAHSPISNSYTLPTGATHIRAISYDQNDTMLWTSFSWIDSNNYHFASTSPEDGHYNDWFEIPTGAVKVNFGVRHSKLNNTTAMSLNDIKSVDITVQTVSEIEVDVWNSGTGWLNGNYYSGNSSSFTTSWYYSYHSNPDAYIPIPNGATHVMVMGISNENDSHFEGGGVNVFSGESHSGHIYWWGCAWEWHEISSDAKFVQIDVKWNNNNTRTISGSDIKSVTLVWKLPALEINQAINVKYGNGLTVNQNNELEVDLGSGLRFDANGAIEVTGGGGDTIAEGDGISITDDQQTGDKIISVNYGDGLTIDPVTGALMFDGQLPEGTIIKKMTYIGDGGATNNIQFEKKPIAILSIYGAGRGTKVSSCAAPIDAPVLNVSYGTGNGSNSAGMVSCTMSYNDTTNVLSLTGGNDPGVRCNMSGETYTVYYLIKGHTEGGTSATNEVSVVKTFTYVGTGTMTNNIQFPETPDMLLSIAGPGGDNTYVTTTPTPINASKLEFAISDGNNNNGVGGALMSFDDTTNVLTLTSSRHVSWAFNTLDTVYQVRYVVNEIIATKPAAGGVYYEAGNAITFNTTSQTSDISIDLFSTMTDWVNKSYDQHVGGNFVNAPEAIHSNVTPLSNLYEIPEPNAKFTIEPLDVNDNLLHCIVDYHDLNGNHIGWNGEFISDPTKQYQCPTGAIFISVAVVHTNHTSAMSVSECKSVTITWKNITETHTTINADVASTSQFGVVKVGSGLSIDPVTGALNVTGGGGGGGGDTVAQGNGINITTDQQTGDKVIAVNAGSGLAFDQTTHALEVSSGVVTSIAPTQNTPGSITVTEGDGTATPVQVLSQMGGATSSTAGTAGYVPAPSSGDDDAYLRGDGTWDDDVVTENDLLTLVFVPDDYTPPTP